MRESRGLTCGHSRRVVDMPVVGEPDAVRLPPTIVPVQEPDVEVATGIAVDGAPEENVAGTSLFILLPFLRNEVRVGEEIVENVGVQDGFGSEFHPELVALNGFAFRLIR